MASIHECQPDSSGLCHVARFTVVIPTWNEEGWLPALLSRLRKMNRVAHVVVADNWSEDGTRDLALAEGVQVIDGGTPARGRNSGAMASTGQYIVFADADVVFTSETLDRAAEYLDGNSDVIAVHFPLRPLGAPQFVRFCYRVMDRYFWLLSRLGIAQGVGTFLVVRRSGFNRSNGFDESMAVGEDADLIRRLSHFGTVRYDRTIAVGTSPRRFLTENPWIFAMKTCLWAVLRLLGLRASFLRYQWRTYPASLSRLDRVTFEEFFSEFESPLDKTSVDSRGSSHGA
jgi:glycosyltransferase involved in cell wall biosynthesis